MKVLIIEDDEYKRTEVAEIVRSEIKMVQISEARSLQSALRAVLGHKHDLVILDMTMPTFDITDEEDGGRPQAFGGREVLRYMKRRNVLTPVVVLTQFDRFGSGSGAITLEQLDTELRATHPSQYYGTIHYSVVFENWKNELVDIVREVHEGIQP